jgi:hypothetical protein
MCGALVHVRFGPIADIIAYSLLGPDKFRDSRFDNFIGPGEERRWRFEAQSPGRLQTAPVDARVVLELLHLQLLPVRTYRN